MELNEIVGGILMGIGIGFAMLGLYIWILLWILYQRIKHRIDRMIAEVVDEAESNLVGIDIEVDRGTYFCYNSEDKQFVCQGATVAEIKQAFEVRYPGKTAYLAGGDPEVVATFKTELLKLSINENSSSQ
jgi:hypothetical protein